MSKKTKVTTVIVAAAVIIILAAVGLFLFIQKGREPEKADPVKAEEDYNAIKKEAADDADDPMQREIDFDVLKEVNADVYAWISVPGTNVDYPILQSATEADDYYLNTTIDKKQGFPGSIYTEKYNSITFLDPVTVIYGHDLQEGTMFSELHKYSDKAFFDSNPYVYIYLPDKALKYQIFAAVTLDDRYLLGSYNFRDPIDFQMYVDELRGSIDGNVNIDVAVTPDKSVITLSTCLSEFPDQRWLVNAALVEGEP